MRAPGHKMILASAGSGKTYALTNRFVQLLALGAKPERIAALTFTRKAAGEFFDEILTKLARAATDPAFAEKIAGEIGGPKLPPADFGRMLRGMVDAMPRLCLGTLDGFFARVVRAFPLELGLGGDFDLLEEHASRLERRRVLRRMFGVTGALEAAQQDFIEAFKRATFGAEEKRLGSHLDGFLDEHAEIFLAAPEAAAWGRAERIWPQGSAALAKAGTRAEAARALHAALPWAGPDRRPAPALGRFLRDPPRLDPRGAPAEARELHPREHLQGAGPRWRRSWSSASAWRCRRPPRPPWLTWPRASSEPSSRASWR